MTLLLDFLASNASPKRTYLRYPGGKSKVAKSLLSYFPPNFKEYREPMIGGGSVFLLLKNIYPDMNFWINDVYYNLYCFWNIAKYENSHLVSALLDIKMTTSYETCSEKFLDVKLKINTGTEFDRAVGFYYLNKCSFSGLTESGTCSKQAWVQNFSERCIFSLRDLEAILSNVKITNYDYSNVINFPGEDVFIYLDPPYDIGKVNSLYGRDGEIHSSFDHEKFYSNINKCPHKFLVTYNNSEILRNRYREFTIEELSLRYTMRQHINNNKFESKIGSELLIRNY